MGVMFSYKLDILNKGRIQKYCVIKNTAPISYAGALDLWQHNESFRSFFNSLLADAPFSAYRWETPPVSIGTVNREFEFVLLTAQHWSDPQTRRHSKVISPLPNQIPESSSSRILAKMPCLWFLVHKRLIPHTPISQHFQETGLIHRIMLCGRRSDKQCSKELRIGLFG